MKPYLTGILALLLLLAVTAACVQTSNTSAPGTGTAEIRYTFYGGFVMPTHAIQQLVVTPDTATFTVMSHDGNVTEKFSKPLSKEQYAAIAKVFADNNFPSFKERYEEGQSHVTDVGWADITVIGNGRNKTVTVYNFDEYLPDGLVKIRQKLQETIEYTRAPDETEVRTIAEAWIKGAPTYAYDGSGLTLVNATRSADYPIRSGLTYRFTSSHTGYGNRSGMVTAQVITEHTIRVTVAGRTVESAVIDDTWDETGQYLIGSPIPLTYLPMQCEQTPWDAWEANSGRVYIRAPTEEEIIRHYYSAVYGIEVSNITRSDTGMVTCQACGVCPGFYRFGVTVNASVMQVLVDEGWRKG
ncbi:MULTISPECIES: hypothetical protein [unclassified Methanoregula]|uniref:hypothetical protein n=1 Tax=unclassified Methanoregula TaxID=2649730 RepID=UPI0025ECC745|nr:MULTISPECIES: hypothetical protein [unclassified Methanoregula]